MVGIYTNLRGARWYVTVEKWEGNEMLVRFRDGFTMYTHITRVHLICVSVLDEVRKKYQNNT